jgi:hypothetical protein
MLEKRKGIPSFKGYYKAKSGETFHYDSMSELSVMLFLDEKDIIKWRKNTTLRIPYLFENKERKYIPDFILEGSKFFPAAILEIKGSNDKPELPFKIEAAKNYCKEHEMEFSLLPYDEVRKLIDWNKVREYHKNNALSHKTLSL